MVVTVKLKSVAHELYAGQDKMLIVSCYRGPYMKIESRVWKKFFVQLKGKFLIDGDFNSHRHTLDNSKKCTFSNNLFHCINELEINITFLNNFSQTYISNATASMTALDVTFVDTI